MSDRHHDWPARLALDPTVFVAPGAIVVGDVRLGARSSVWFHTIVRGDTAPIEVGDETNLQDGTVVHVDEGLPARIGARVTVGHRCIVHGCEIGDECLIGMGSIVLSGARVGAGSLLGAGALVREGQEIPPGSLALGAPATVRGPVDDRHRAAIREGAAHYVALARGYLERGFAGAVPAAHRAGPRAGIDRGTMSEFEWERLLDALARTPRWAIERLGAEGAERWRRAPRAGAWCAHEVACHLADGDRDVFGPRIERVLQETMPLVPSVDLASEERVSAYRGREPGVALEAWRAERERLVARIASLGPADWDRVWIHSIHGAMTLAQLVRGWVEHDLMHRRQMAKALGEVA